MEKKQWKMEESFVFPGHAGLPIEANSIKVTPGFTEKRTDEAVRLDGIYHIAVNVKFEEGERADGFPEDAVFIGDVELKEGAGYFEYAVPLHVDLPAEVQSPIQINATDAKTTADGQGSFTIAWNVECSGATQPVAVAEEIQPEVLVEKQEEMVTAFAITNNTEEKRGAAEVLGEVEIEEETYVAVASPVVHRDSTSFDDYDGVLSFLAGLEDGVSSTVFRSNDVFVQDKG